MPYFYKSKTGRDGETGKEFYMQIDWRNNTDREVLALAKATRFREIRKIQFDGIREESKEVLEYLVSNYPDKLRIFVFYVDKVFDYKN